MSCTHVLTILSHFDTLDAFTISETMSKFPCMQSVQAVRRLSPWAMEVAVSMNAQSSDYSNIADDLWNEGKRKSVDLVLQNNSVFRKHKRLIIFDMDGTLIDEEVINELGRLYGVHDLIAVCRHAI